MGCASSESNVDGSTASFWCLLFSAGALFLSDAPAANNDDDDAISSRGAPAILLTP